MKIKNKRIQVIVAHLDDEMFGMGGTLIKLSNPKLKNKIEVISVCHGFGGMDENRITNFFTVLETLGIDGKVIGFDDVSLGKIDDLEINSYLEEEINEFNPDIIFTHTDKDIHIDHQVISKGVSVASRRSKCSIIHFSIPGNTEYSHNTFNPNLFIDISKESVKKVSLLKYYKLYKKNDPLNLHKIKIRDDYYGSLIHTKSAEAFEIKRSII